MCNLTDKQEAFCHEYLIDFCARQAAIRAGYSPHSAHVSGSRNLVHEDVAKRLQQLIEGRNKRLEVSADYVLQRLIDIDKLDIADIMDAQGNLLPIREWTEAWRLSVSSIDVSEIKSADALLKKIRMPDKLKNLELIGKHIDVSAFRERVEVSDKGGRPLIVQVATSQAKKDLEGLYKSLSEDF